MSPKYLATTALSYLTTKGYMLPVLGSKWTLSYTLPTIDFNAPRAPHASCKDNIIAAVEYEVANLGSPPQPGDFYFWGGAIAAASRLAYVLVRQEYTCSDIRIPAGSSLTKSGGLTSSARLCLTSSKHSATGCALLTKTWSAT